MKNKLEFLVGECKKDGLFQRRFGNSIYCSVSYGDILCEYKDKDVIAVQSENRVCNYFNYYLCNKDDKNDLGEVFGEINT